MGNSIDTIMHKILARTLPVLRESCILPLLISYDFKDEAARPGSTINVPYSMPRGTQAVVPGVNNPAPVDATNPTLPLVIDDWRKSDPFGLTNKELGEIDASETFLPNQVGESIRALANYVNQKIALEMKYAFYGAQGTPGTTPFASDVSAIVNARMLLNQQLCPGKDRDRSFIVDPVAEAAMLMRPEFANFDQSGDQAVKIEGVLGRKYGFNIGYDDAMPYHTAGTITTGLAAKAATAQAVGTTTIQATTAASTGACALKQGDIITIAGQAQTYVVTADATQAAANSAVNVNVSPGLVVALTGGEAITVKASHRCNFAFHKKALICAVRPPDMLEVKGARTPRDRVTYTDPQTGLTFSLEHIPEYKQDVWEFDILFGVKVVRPQFGMRLMG